MDIIVKTNKGNTFDIEDSILLTALGESDTCNAALSFYNKELEYGISYFPDRNMFVFQNDNYCGEYWNDDKYNEMIAELSNHINLKELDDYGLPFDFNFIVNYFLNEMDNYYDWYIKMNSEFSIKLKEILSEDKQGNNDKNNVLDYYFNNPFFMNKNGYDNFIKCMITAAEDGKLPIMLATDEPERITLYDIKEFSKRFKKDTGLYIDFRLTTCNNCGKLHIHFVVDKYPDDENGENIVYL